MTTAPSPAEPAPDDADRDATSQQNLHAQDHPKAEGDPDASARQKPDDTADDEG